MTFGVPIECCHVGYATADLSATFADLIVVSGVLNPSRRSDAFAFPNTATHRSGILPCRPVKLLRKLGSDELRCRALRIRFWLRLH
jgi:hypothetical protein